MSWLMDAALAQTLAHWAQVIALLAGACAVIKYFWDRRERQRGEARALYASFMDDALNHPDMYGGVWTKEARNDPKLASKYSYFMGKFLWAAEEVLRCHPNDENWQETILVTLREHADYLRSDEFIRERGGYPKHVTDLVDEVRDAPIPIETPKRKRKAAERVLQEAAE